jgi:uncharacterized membrane protein HdeD (DUF308 family)
MTASTPALAVPGLFGDLQKNWVWLLVIGIISVALGSFGLGRVFLVTLAGGLFYGWLILIAGGVQNVQIFKSRGWKGRALHALLAVFHIVAGIIVITAPVLASNVFTLMLALFILASGAARIVLALQHRESAGWGWLLFGGVVSAVLGGLIAIQWPASSLFVIGLFISIELIMNGWGLILLALAARRGAAPSPAAAESGPAH